MLTAKPTGIPLKCPIMWVEVAIDHTDNYLQERLLPPQSEDGVTGTPVVPAEEDGAKKTV